MLSLPVLWLLPHSYHCFLELNCEGVGGTEMSFFLINLRRSNHAPVAWGICAHVFAFCKKKKKNAISCLMTHSTMLALGHLLVRPALTSSFTWTHRFSRCVLQLCLEFSDCASLASWLCCYGMWRRVRNVCRSPTLPLHLCVFVRDWLMKRVGGWKWLTPNLIEFPAVSDVLLAACCLTLLIRQKM